MDALKATGLCALLAAPPEAAQPCHPVAEVSSPAIERWQSLIDVASRRFGIPAKWIRAVMARESAGLTTLYGQPIVSPAGAMGLMQLMPGTWSELRARYGFGNDPFEPLDNILAGTAYLREMFDRYGYPDLFIAYNAGPIRLDAILAGRKSLPAVTILYLDALGIKSFSANLKYGISTSSPPARGMKDLRPSEDGLFFPVGRSTDRR